MLCEQAVEAGRASARWANALQAGGVGPKPCSEDEGSGGAFARPAESGCEQNSGDVLRSRRPTDPFCGKWLFCSHVLYYIESRLRRFRSYLRTQHARHLSKRGALIVPERFHSERPSRPVTRPVFRAAGGRPRRRRYCRNGHRCIGRGPSRGHGHPVSTAEARSAPISRPRPTSAAPISFSAFRRAPTPSKARCRASGRSRCATSWSMRTRPPAPI